ncbi:hypothetical protein [Enterococcus faecium]
MNENYKTIKELADELGVSKSYVDKIIRILKLHTKLDKVGNKYVISKKQEKAIITRIEKPKTTTESTTKLHTKVNSEVDFLKEEIAYLKSNHDKQLTSKDKQIETLSNLLDQQQRLALQDKKLLDEYKSEINDLKALKMPQEDMKDGSSIKGEAQEEIERLKAQLKLSEEERNKSKGKEPVKTESKKWWQLWK